MSGGDRRSTKRTFSARRSAASPRTRRSSAPEPTRTRSTVWSSAAAARTAVSRPCRAPMVPACITTHRSSRAAPPVSRAAGPGWVEVPLVGPVEHHPHPGRVHARRDYPVAQRRRGDRDPVRGPVDPRHRRGDPPGPPPVLGPDRLVLRPDVLHVHDGRHPAQQAEQARRREGVRRRQVDVRGRRRRPGTTARSPPRCRRTTGGRPSGRGANRPRRSSAGPAGPSAARCGSRTASAAASPGRRGRRDSRGSRSAPSPRAPARASSSARLPGMNAGSGGKWYDRIPTFIAALPRPRSSPPVPGGDRGASCAYRRCRVVRRPAGARARRPAPGGGGEPPPPTRRIRVLPSPARPRAARPDPELRSSWQPGEFLRPVADDAVEPLLARAGRTAAAVAPGPPASRRRRPGTPRTGRRPPSATLAMFSTQPSSRTETECSDAGRRGDLACGRCGPAGRRAGSRRPTVAITAASVTGSRGGVSIRMTSKAGPPRAVSRSAMLPGAEQLARVRRDRTAGQDPQAAAAPRLDHVACRTFA